MLLAGGGASSPGWSHRGTVLLSTVLLCSQRYVNGTCEFNAGDRGGNPVIGPIYNRDGSSVLDELTN